MHGNGGSEGNLDAAGDLAIDTQDRPATSLAALKPFAGIIGSGGSGGRGNT